MADFSPTPEQDSIVEAVRSSTDSLMVKAYAGCAKTTTILLAAKALPVEPALALAFNKKIQLELEKKLPSHFAVKTMNGLGHSAWSQAIGRRLTIYCDPDITFGKDRVGGIRISHVSHIDKPADILLTVSRGRRTTFTVQPLAADA